MPKIFKRIKWLIPNLLIFLLSAIVAVFSGEMLLRLKPDLIGIRYGYFRYKPPDAIGKTGINRGPFRPSLVLGYEFIPNARPGETVINSYGLVGREYKLKKDKGVYRILILGDSIAAQDGVRKYLEEKLNNCALLNPKYQFELWNASVPGYDLRRYAIYLKYKGINYVPDMVMIFLCLNDFEPNTFVYYKDERGIVRFDFAFRELSKTYFSSPFLIKHSYIYRFLITKLDSYLADKKRNQNTPPEEENGRFYLGIIKDICQRNNIILSCIMFPYLKPLNKYDNIQIRQYEIMRKVLRDSNLSYIDLHNYLSEKKLYSLRENKDDDIHPGPQGRYLIADIIYDYLLDNFLKYKI
jgi:lysophospholipase L1-like esterase